MRRHVAETGDDLIPMQPIGRPVAKGNFTALEYDPVDAPEYVCDEFGNGFFSWEPVTPEGRLGEPGAYRELALPVPEERLSYLRSGGFLESGPEDDCRYYIDGEVFSAYGREWRHITIKGDVEAVQAAERRLMSGILRRRPWDPETVIAPPPDRNSLANGAANEAGVPAAEGAIHSD